MFRCELLNIANDKIRIHYWVPINDPKYKARFKHSLGEEYEPGVGYKTVFFKRSSEFSAQIHCKMDPSLDGLKSWFALFHTKIGKNESAYNNWNFSSRTDSYWWDSVDAGFWFAKTSTILIYSVPYTIGSQ